MAEQYTIDQFADVIRKKYPGAYDKRKNTELVDAWIKKYPVYANRIKQAPGPASSKPSKPPSPELMRQRREVSKAELESNQPESTVGSRTREAAIGVLEPFTIPSLYETAKTALHAGLTGNAKEALDLALGVVRAPVMPVVNLEEGIRTGDYDRAAYGAGGFLSQTAPAVAGAVDTVAPGVSKAIETHTPTTDVASLRNKARTFAQNRVGASAFRTTEPIVKGHIADVERAGEARAEAARTAEAQTSANRQKTAEQLEANRAAERENSLAETTQRSLKEGSARLGKQVQDLNSKLRTEGNEKYDAVRQAVGNDPGVPLAELAEAARYAEQNILKGSAENIKQFRELARKAPEDEGIVSGGVTFPPDSALYKMLQESGAIDPGGTIPFDQLQGYSSEIGAKLAKGGLPGDIYQALKHLKNKIDAAKTTIAERNGAGAALKDADTFWHSYMDALYDKDSAIAKVRESVGTVDPEFYADAFTKGKAGDVAIAKLKQLETRHSAEASSVADLARNLRSANSELQNIKTSTVKPVEPPARVAPKEVPEPAAPSAEDITAAKRQKARTTADTTGRMRSTTAFRTLSAPIRWMESNWLQRQSVLEWISKPTEADIRAAAQLPEPTRSTLVNNLRQIIQQERAAGRQVLISPEVQKIIGAAGTVSGGVKNRREALERLGRAPK